MDQTKTTDCYICGRGTTICLSCRKGHLAPDATLLSSTDGMPVFDLHELYIPVPAISTASCSTLDPYADVKEAKAIRKAEQAGVKVVRGTPKTLLLDLDTGEQFCTFKSMIDFVDSKFGIDKYEQWHSKSGSGHNHVVVHLSKPLAAAHRIGLEAVMGSDPKRALLNIYKHSVLGIEEPSLLFQPANSLIAIEKI